MLRALAKTIAILLGSAPATIDADAPRGSGAEWIRAFRNRCRRACRRGARRWTVEVQKLEACHQASGGFILHSARLARSPP